MRRQIGYFFFYIGIIVLFIGIISLQSDFIAYGVCVAGVLIVAFGLFLIFRNRPTPVQSERFRLFRKKENKK